MVRHGHEPPLETLISSDPIRADAAISDPSYLFLLFLALHYCVAIEYFSILGCGKIYIRNVEKANRIISN